MNINITSSATQQATAAQITALATHILHRKGQVDFTGTNVSVQCSDSLPLGAAAIVQTCAHKQGATSFSISGASDLTDSVWALVETIPTWLADLIEANDFSILNLFTALVYDADVANSFNGVGRLLDIPNSGNAINGITLPYSWSQIGKVEMSVQDMDNTDNWMWFAEWDGSTVNGNWLAYDDHSGFTVTFRTSITDRTELTDATIIFTCSGTNKAHLYSWNDTTWSRHMRSGYARIYSTDNTTLLMYLIPMTKDSVNGMYDLIGQQFYTNTGSGAFTIE